jgi:hypothetical protein
VVSCSIIIKNQAQNCELLHTCRPLRLLDVALLGIAGAQCAGAAGTRYFEPDGVSFFGRAIFLTGHWTPIGAGHRGGCAVN